MKHGGEYLDLEDFDDDYPWKHHYLYGHPQHFTEPPSAGMYGSRGPLFDKTTGPGEAKTTLPAAKPEDQKQVPRYFGDRESHWEAQEADYKEKMKWDKEIQKFKQKE